MNNFFQRIFTYIKSHVIMTAIIVIALGWSAWHFTHRAASSDVTTSVIGQVTRGTLIASVSGTGKLAAREEYDLKPKNGGDVTAVLVRAGETVKKGDVLVRLDATDASRAARDARIALENARVAAGKQNVQNAALSSSVTPEETLSNMVSRMTKFYADYAQIDKNFDSTLHDRTADPNVSHVRNVEYYASYDDKFVSYPKDTDTLYALTKAKYAEGLRTLEAAKSGNDDDRRAALKSAEDLTRSGMSLTKMTMDLLRAFQYRLAQSNSTHSAQSLVSTETATTQNDINTLNAAYKDFLDADNALLDYKQSVDQAPYDTKTSALSVTAKANALSDAVDKISDYTIVSPIDGIVASVPVKEGDSITNGTVAVAVITNDLEANLSLSEVDAAKIAVGQKATLTFDAFPDLTLTGKVVEKDLLGTVTQNVVSYTVKVAPDTSDSRLLPNMSVSADVITSSKPDVLMVTSSAIKTNGESVVQVPDPHDPALAATSTSKGVVLTLSTIPMVVTTGLVGNSQTEILKGLKEGDKVVVRTNKSGAASAQNRSIFQAAGGGGGGGTRGLGGGR